MSRNTPSLHQFAFQDPFAPLGTMASTTSSDMEHNDPKSTSPGYHYSPTAEPRRMSEITAAGWSSSHSPFDHSRSRGESIVTITPLSSQTPVAHFSPPLSTASTFNSRASMSAIEQDQPLTFGGSPAAGPGAGGGGGGEGGVVNDSPKGTTMTLLPAIRPRILRYKTSPARFTGLGLDIVVKAQPPSGSNLTESTMSSSSLSNIITGPGAGSTIYTISSSAARERERERERRRSSTKSFDTATATNSERRRSSQKSITTTTTAGTSTTDDQDRRRSSTTSASSIERERERKGVWAVVDVVDTLSTTELSIPSSSSSLHSSIHTHHPQSGGGGGGGGMGQGASPRGSVYTIEHVSSRSSLSLSSSFSSSSQFHPHSRKGKAPGHPPQAFNFETIISSGDFSTSSDPLAFPRRGSLAVLSQTALGPWAAKSAAAIRTGTGVGLGEELLGAPKGDWQERRGSWAEGWSKK